MASICEIVRWLGDQAEQARRQHVHRVSGGRAARGGRRGARRPHDADRPRPRAPAPADYAEPTDVTAKVTVLAEGTRGLLTQAWREWQQVRSPNPQIFALGVKEVWETTKPLDAVIHTLGWPLPDDAFGGQLHVSAGAETGRSRSGGRPRLPRRVAGRPRAASADEAAPALPALSRGRGDAGVGREDDPRGRLPRPAGAPAAATASCWWATRPGSWTSPRSRASTTPCSRASTPRAPRSPHSRRATFRPRGCRRTTAWWTRATSWPRCIGPGTCGSRSRTDCTSADSRPGS